MFEVYSELSSKRSKELSDDFTPINDVIKDVLSELGKDADKYKNICCIYACSPFITSDDLKNSFQLEGRSFKQFITDDQHIFEQRLENDDCL